MEIIDLTEDEFDDLRFYERLETGVAYHLTDYGPSAGFLLEGEQWAYSPDGEGAYWYGSYEEILENH